MSGTVTSNAIGLLQAHGINVALSGLLSLDCKRLRGSLQAGI